MESVGSVLPLLLGWAFFTSPLIALKKGLRTLLLALCLRSSRLGRHHISASAEIGGEPRRIRAA